MAWPTIGRCTAPCVGLVSEEAYAEQVRDAMLFLEGKNQKVLTRLITRMELASRALEFEAAALYRDQISTLKQMQAHQFVSGRQTDIDFVALAQQRNLACIQVVSIRGGRNLGQRSYFPSQAEGCAPQEVMDAFLSQYYQERLPPSQLVISHKPIDPDLLADVFSTAAGRRIHLQWRPRGERKKMLDMAADNAGQAVAMRLASKANMAAQFEALQNLIGLEEAPGSVEVSAMPR